MASILIVDDEASIRSVLQRYLERSGDHRIFTARDGVEALETLTEAAIDIAFVDLHMPRLSGIDVVRRLDRSFPAVRYAVMSGMEDAIHVAQRELSVDPPLLRKPFDLAQVDAIITVLLAQRPHRAS